MNTALEKFCELSVYIMVETKGRAWGGLKQSYGAIHVSDNIVSAFHGFKKKLF